MSDELRPPRGMSAAAAERAVADRAIVRLWTAQGSAYATGRIVSYSIVPTVCIETADGERIHWRHDLAGRVDVSVADERVDPETPMRGHDADGSCCLRARLEARTHGSPAQPDFREEWR